MSSLRDEELIARCLKGEEQAFERLYYKYCDRIYHLVYRIVLNKEDALDVVQEVFMKAFQSLSQFEGRSSFYTWLCRIAMNKAIDCARQRKKSLSYEELTQGEENHSQGWDAKEVSPSDLVGRKELEKAFWKALAELPEIHRSVFVLYTWEGLSYKEIGEVLQCSLGTVMSRLHYARKKLQKLLESWSEMTEKEEQGEAL